MSTTDVTRATVRVPEPPAPGRAGLMHRSVIGALVVVAVVSIGLRFWARSPLWLDEAQSVAIARLPLDAHGSATSMWTGLRQDGSPPLYYLMLHWWMQAFGHSDEAVRSMSGVLSVLTAWPLWRLARRMMSPVGALGALLVFATSPFDIRYATETRMYSLLVLLTVLGGLALHRVLTEGVRPWRIVGLAAASGALMLTHYWSLFLLLTVVAGLLVVVIFARAERQRRALWSIVGLALGVIPFAPWAQSFLYQLAHTGTPWGYTATWAELPGTFAQWAGGSSNDAMGLTLCIGVLLALGAFGVGVDGRHVLIDLRGRDPGRLLVALTVGVLVVAIGLGQIIDTAWAPRYTATAFVPYVLAVGAGAATLLSHRIVAVVLAVLVVLGVVASVPNIYTDRTMAAQAARVINANAEPGDIVLACPDQIGPDLARLVKAGIPVLAVPTLASAARVDWVNYVSRQQNADAATVVAKALAMVGSTGKVFLAYSPGYRTYETLCPQVQEDLDENRYNSVTLLTDPEQIFEHESVTEYLPGDTP